MATLASPTVAADGASQEAPEELRRLIGTTIGDRYKVISLLGVGGMGAVYLVEHINIRKRMALKVLPRERMQDREMVARFEREALAAAHLEHPNIVAATDLGRTEDGSLFLVLEYIEGRSLRDELALGSMMLPRVLHIARQITRALVRAHSVRLVHRDLKPENIMLLQREGDPDFVKVLDFGIAKIFVETLLATATAATDTDALTRAGAIFGTPTYMAPEQAVGGEVDGRTDLYSLGIIIYELLTGEPPFAGDDAAALMKQHLVSKVPRLTERVPALRVPLALEELIMRLLEKRPDKRPGEAREVVEVIDQIGAAEGLLFEPSQSLPHMAIPTRIQAPSRADVSNPEPDTALQAVAAKAPLPSISPRILTGSSEVVWPAIKRGYERVRAVARTYGASWWDRGLQFIHQRLPEERRGSAETILRITVGSMVSVLLVAVLILAWPGGELPPRARPGGTSMTGYATDREMEIGVEKGVAKLEALVAKYPKDARCHRALVRAQAARKDYVGALRALVPLLQLDPSAKSDEAMGQIVAEAALVPEASDSAMAFLETAMGDQGVDLLLDLAETTTTEPLRTKINQSLAHEGVRKLASPEALLLLELRAAGSCEQKKALLPRAAKHGDARVRRYLEGLQAPRGCGVAGQSDCWPCLRKSQALQNAISAISQRGGAPG